jgi:hypothetical protein
VKAFYNASPDLHAKDVTSSSFKSILQKPFKHVRTEQFHLSHLHSTRQLKNEDPQDFADRCPGLAQNLIPQIEDPTAQAQYNDQVQKVLLTCYIADLTGTAGRHVRFAPPYRYNGQNFRMAMTVERAEKKEWHSEALYLSREEK